MVRRFQSPARRRRQGVVGTMTPTSPCQAALSRFGCTVQMSSSAREPATIWSPLASTPCREESEMRILFVVTAMACLPAFRGRTQDSSCLSQQIVPGGSVVETRFIAAPLPRVREAVADAMQAAGVQLFKNTEDYLEGERIDERVKSMHLDRGDEEIHVKLDAMTQNGQSGTEARAETFRREMKKGEPKHMWSKSVLDHAACLANVLSIDDPLHRTTVPVVDGVAGRIPDGTAIEARSCHFIFSTDLKVGKVIPFETDALLLVNGQIVAPAGSLIVATVEQLTDSKSWGR